MPNKHCTEQECALGFLECWIAGDGAGSFPLLQLTWASKLTRVQAEQTLLSRFSAQPMDEYRVRDIAQTKAICDVTALVKLRKEGLKQLRFRMVREAAPYQPTIDGKGKWGVNPNSICIEDPPKATD